MRLSDRKSLVAVFVVLGLVLAMSFAAPASAKLVQAIGKAPITGEDTASAEQEAINDALRKAVEQGAGSLLDSLTQVENGAVIRDDILSQSRGFITKYDVLHSGPSGDGRMYLVTLEADVNTQSLREKIRAQEQSLTIRHKRMGNKNVLVLGIKQFKEDFTWATKPFELSVQMIKDKLNQAQFIVLDEGAIRNFAGVAANLKTGGWRKPALYQMAKEAGADWMIVLGMDGTRTKAGPDNAFNSVQMALRLELIDVNGKTVLSTKYEKATKNLNTTNPRYADWREAATDAGRDAAELATTDIVNTLISHHRQYQPSEPQRYVLEFHRFQDQHVDAIMRDVKALPGVSSSRVQSQTQRLTVVQVFSSTGVDALRTGLKRILASYGYKHPRIKFSGNRISFTNTTRF